MANEYHDAAGRFCSEGDMQSAIRDLAVSGDHSGVQNMIAGLKTIEEKREKAKSTVKGQEYPTLSIDSDRDEWRMSRKLHRDEWRLNGKLHRTDGPAVEYPSGSREWWVDGRQHRVDGPAVERPNGTREWWMDGKRHREDGPAIEWPDGTREWWVNGFPHRTDGPAVERPNGTREWWVAGTELSETEFKARQRAS